MKVIIIDPINGKYSHAIFNATFIEAILRITSLSECYALLEESQLKLPVFKQIEKDYYNIKFKSLSNLSKNKFGYWIRNIMNFIKLCSLLKKNHFEILYILASDNIFIPLLLPLLERKFNVKIFVILHNNIENSKNSNIKKWLWSKVLNENIKGIVLADFLEKKGKKFFESKHIYTIKHPSYLHLKSVNNLSNKIQKKYDFLLLGRHSDLFFEKGFSDRFFSTCSEYTKNRKIVLIKRESKVIFDSKGVYVEDYKFPLSEKEYWELLQSSKFLIIPPSAGERLTASGVHIDAITLGIPTIAPNKGAFKEFTPKSSQCLLYDDSSIDKCFAKALDINDATYRKLSKDLVIMAQRLSIFNLTNSIEYFMKDG